MKNTRSWPWDVDRPMRNAFLGCMLTEVILSYWRKLNILSSALKCDMTSKKNHLNLCLSLVSIANVQMHFGKDTFLVKCTCSWKISIPLSNSESFRIMVVTIQPIDALTGPCKWWHRSSLSGWIPSWVLLLLSFPLALHHLMSPPSLDIRNQEIR